MLVLLIACVEPGAEPHGASDGASERRIAEGTREADGVLGLLNDPATTLTTLDDDAALEKRAATNLIAHRDGADARTGTADDDPFDSIEEVDAVKYVGDTALAQLLAYAQAQGYVPAGSDTWGTLESVTFTWDEAEGIVDLANTADQATLDDDVALDARAARNLVAERPFATLDEVAGVSYVGTSALTHLQSWVDTHPDTLALPTADAYTALTTASDGLWFTSESDYPLVAWKIDAPATTAITSSNLLSTIASAYEQRDGTTALADRTVEQSSLAWFFDPYTVPQDWWEEDRTAQAPAWQALETAIVSDLTDVTVWRFGRSSSWGLVGDIDVWIVGVSADGGLVGIHTVSIET